MKKLEITLTEEQYQQMQEEINYANRVHLSEGVFGRYELCLSVGIPNIFGGHLIMKTNTNIDLGEVDWKL